MMIFKSIEEYDNKINELDQKITEYLEYVKLHPEKVGVKSNLETLIRVRNILINEKKGCLNDD